MPYVLYLCVIAFIEVFLGVVISLERFAMAVSSRAQKTKETGIDAERRISVLGTYVWSIVGDVRGIQPNNVPVSVWHCRSSSMLI